MSLKITYLAGFLLFDDTPAEAFYDLDKGKVLLLLHRDFPL
jgi:hypothetical protein